MTYQRKSAAYGMLRFFFGDSLVPRHILYSLFYVVLFNDALVFFCLKAVSYADQEQIAVVIF